MIILSKKIENLKIEKHVADVVQVIILLFRK